MHPFVRKVARRLPARIRRAYYSSGPALPAGGYDPSPFPSPALDSLADEELAQLNAILDWNCFTVDSRGRRFGNRAWRGKRETPQPIPDGRIVKLDELIGLADKSVLEVGCFEGVHTVALAQRAHRVTAIDVRVENVVKTMVRCGFYGGEASVFVLDLEKASDDPRLHADVLHHVGVLYHLRDPVAHLAAIAPKISTAILLDTHIADGADPLERYESRGYEARYRYYAEPGVRRRHRAPTNVFDGVYDHAKWLHIDDLVGLLKSLWFGYVDLLERREERNGMRVELLVRRS